MTSIVTTTGTHDTTGIVTMEPNSQSSVMIGQESDEQSLAIASNTSSNMRNYFQRATGAMSLQQGCEAVVVNAAPIAQSGILDNRVPLNLLPYQKDQITIEHARMTYRYTQPLVLFIPVKSAWPTTEQNWK